MAFGKVRTIFWFLKRPRLYPQLIYLLTRKLFLRQSRFKNTREEATSWCAARAIDTSTAIAKITGSPLPCSVREKFGNVFAVATQRAMQCPVAMGGAGNVDLLYWIAENCMAEKVIETGIAYGWSSLALLLSMKNRTNSILLSTDMPYPDLNNDEYVGCVVPADLKSHWRILNYADRQAIPKALKELRTIDMCHYDSDKSYDGRMWAYPRLWKALRPGGVFMSDDIQDNVAFCEFVNLVKIDPIVVAWNGKYVGILIKPGGHTAPCIRDPISEDKTIRAGPPACQPVRAGMIL